MSNTLPLPIEKKEIILAHALAGQYLGHKFIYLEMGSGSQKIISAELVSYIKNNISIPIIVGGGITTIESAKSISNAGADFIVIGGLLEIEQNNNLINKICNTIHGN